MVEELDTQVSSTSMDMFKSIDERRIYKSDYHFSQKAKTKRKVRRREKNKQADAFQKDYKSGEFHLMKEPRKKSTKRKGTIT